MNELLAIVHGGGEPGSELLKSPDFVNLTEHFVRVALKKMIDIAKATGSPTVDWDNLIIPS